MCAVWLAGSLCRLHSTVWASTASTTTSPLHASFLITRCVARLCGRRSDAQAGAQRRSARQGSCGFRCFRCFRPTFGVLSVLRGEPQPLQVGKPCPISAPRQCRQCLDSPCPPPPSSPRDTQMETNCTRQFGSRSPSRAIGLIFTSVAGRVDGCESSPRRSVSRCGLCLAGLRRRYALIDSIKGREHRENGLVSEQRAAR